MERTATRRSALAALGAAAASAGCVDRVRNIAGRDGPSQLTLTISTTPADDDPHAIRIARHLAENLTAVGVDARVNTMSEADLHRRALLNHDFEIYVGQFPRPDPFDPDVLHSLTHSSFAAETGWQNPFGLTELGLDDLLAEQRSADGDDRAGLVAEIQRTICAQQPFTVVAFPDELTAVRETRFGGWGSDRPISPSGLLSLDGVGETDDGEPRTLRLTTTDARITENWNPIAAEYRRHGTFTSLLYDPLVRVDGGDPVPWLGRDWERIDATTFRVTIRDAAWHDGEPLTADDVAFTYAFLTDTSMDEMESAVPAPRFRGESSLVESTDVVDERTVDVSIGDVNPEVGLRAFEVPILPEHVWSDRTDPATVAGIEVDEETTAALVGNNADPVGSGPIRFVEATAEESVVFERASDHFLATADPEALPEAYRGKPAFDRLVIEAVGSDIAAVQLVGDGYADATAANLGPNAVPRIGREADARLVSSRSAAFFHVGYNARRAPLSNPRFRAILASLVDKAMLVEEAFQGYARPAASPLAASPEWVPEDLRWPDDDEDPVHPFQGEDGEVDVPAVREAFRDAGYRFSETGELLARDA